MSKIGFMSKALLHRRFKYKSGKKIIQSNSEDTLGMFVCKKPCSKKLSFSGLTLAWAL